METYIGVGLIFFLAGVAHGLFGFGSVLLSIPLLAIFLDIKTVIPLAALAGLSIALIVFLQLRLNFDWEKIYPLAAGAVPGVLLGVFFLKRLDKEVIQWILGLVLILYALYCLLLRPSVKGIRREWAYLFGFWAGCLGGALSAAGPPVIVYTSLQAWSKDQIKVTLQGFFLISGIIVVCCQALSGLTTPLVLRFYGAALPMLVIGTYVGSFFYRFVREEEYRKIILILLAILGIFMI